MTHKIEDHECFQQIVDATGSDATFEKALGIDMIHGDTSSQWVINLFTYTPSLRISTKMGYLVPSFCPMCGEDFREVETEGTSVKQN